MHEVTQRIEEDRAGHQTEEGQGVRHPRFEIVREHRHRIVLGDHVVLPHASVVPLVRDLHHHEREEGSQRGLLAEAQERVPRQEPHHDVERHAVADARLHLPSSLERVVPVLSVPREVARHGHDHHEDEHRVEEPERFAAEDCHDDDAPDVVEHGQRQQERNDPAVPWEEPPDDHQAEDDVGRHRRRETLGGFGDEDARQRDVDHAGHDHATEYTHCWQRSILLLVEVATLVTQLLDDLDTHLGEDDRQGELERRFVDGKVVVTTEPGAEAPDLRFQEVVILIRDHEVRQSEGDDCCRQDSVLLPGLVDPLSAG